MTGYKTPNKPASKQGDISGFYQGVVTEVVATEVDPYEIKVDVPRLGHQGAGPYPYVGPPPAVGDDVWVSFNEGRENDLIIFNAGHQNNDDMTEGVYRFGGAAEQWGVTMHVEPTSYVGSSRASMRFDKTGFGGGGSTIGVNGETSGDLFAYDFNTDHWLLYHGGAWGSYATEHTSNANWTNAFFAIYGGNKHGTPSGEYMRRLFIYPSYSVDGTGTERLLFSWTGQSGGTDPKDNGSSYYWMDIGQFGYWLGNIHPYPDDNRDLGWSSYRWDDIYATNGTIQTSDQQFKTDIADSALGLEFIKSLRPVSFKWITSKGEPGVRTHHGLIGQEVETVLGGSAATTAMWTNSHIEARSEEPAGLDEEGNEITPAMPAVEEHYRQGIRYNELIAPIIKAIQELEVRIAALES